MRTLVLSLVAVIAASGCGKKDEDAKNKPADKPATKAPAAKKQPPPPPPPDPKLVERGAYIAGIAGCPLCHTAVTEKGPDIGRMWAGGLEFAEEFGTWRSPNITQDKKTGIGDWTDEQIIAAIREGKRPDGTQLYPIMPYMYFNKMSNDDAKAVVAFLRTIAPVENAVEGNTDLPLPKPPMPPAEGTAPGAEPVAQGEYLATLMHCHFCHTPMTEQGPDMAKSFSGGFKFEVPEAWANWAGHGTVISSNITQDKKTGIGGWTDEQIVTAVTKLQRKDGSPIRGPMNMYAMGWSKMPEADTAAIVAYLRTIPAIKNKVKEGKYTLPPAPPGGAPQ